MALLVYEIANAAVTGALIIPLFVLWVCGLCMARRRGDPARTGFRYLNIAMPFEVLSLAFNVVTAALVVVLNLLTSTRRYDVSLAIALSEASRRIGLVRILFEFIANSLCFIMFVELGNGFTFARKGVRETSQKVLRFVAIGVAIVMFVIGLAYFGVFNAAYSVLSSGRFASTDYLNRVRNGRLLLGAWYVLMFVVSILLLVQAAVVVHKSRALPTIHNSSVLYLVAVIFFLIRFLYGIVFAGMYLLTTGSLTAIPTPLYLPVIDAIFNDLFFFISLVLVTSMGFRKNNGLVSTGQPGQPSYQYAPGQQVIYTQQPVPQNGYYPHQQPQMQQGWQYPQGQPQQYYVPSQYPAVNQPVAERKAETETPVNGA